MQNNDRQNAQTAPQEQGFVGGGYDPVFTWGGFEDHVMAEERVDAPAADPRGGTPPPEDGEQADANSGDVEHIEITLEEAKAMEEEYERDYWQRYTERALERERLRAEELERDRVITKAREVALEPENMEDYKFIQEIRRGGDQMRAPKLDAEERQERLAKFGEEWLKREQQQKERSQQPVEKTAEPEDMGEYVQHVYKWARTFLKDKSPEDLKWLVENDSKFREEWLDGQPLDDPLAKEIRERFPMREEKHMDEPVNDPGAAVDEN